MKKRLEKKKELKKCLFFRKKAKEAKTPEDVMRYSCLSLTLKERIHATNSVIMRTLQLRGLWVN